MSRWAFSVLGRSALVRTGDGPRVLPAASWSLIGYLLCQRGCRATRQSIAAAIWPEKDDDAARHCLGSTLWRTKRVFDSTGDPLDVSGEAIALKETAWVDAWAFERRALRFLTKDAHSPREAARGLAAALRLYSGAFLPISDADWLLLERERLECLRLDALHGLARLQARLGDWPAALIAAQSLCALEPLREDGHRIVMEAQAALGNRGLALRQYRLCADHLRRELGVEPMPETQALARSLSGQAIGVPPPRDASLRDTLLSTRRALAATLTSIDAALSRRR